MDGDPAPAPITRLWASTELVRRAQRVADAYEPGPDGLAALREVTRTLLLNHILSTLLLTVVTDADFDRVRDELRAGL